MPSIPLPQIPADATVEELAGIVGQLSKSLTWLMGATDKAFVSQDGYAGQNMLSDHSFEMIPTSGVADADQTFAINTAPMGNYFWWNVVGLPRIRSVYNTGVNPYSLFQYQGIIVNNTNYVWQEQRVLTTLPSGPYCFSAHAAPKGGNTAGAKLSCLLTIRALDSAGVELGTVSRSFTVTESYTSNDNGKWSRGFVTYKALPANTVYLEAQIKSDTAEWLEVDGAQLVPNEVPLVYTPENQLWAHMHSLDGAWHYDLIHLGTVTLLDPNGAYPGYLTPGIGSTNKTVIGSSAGVEHNTIWDGTGTIMYACNAEGKNYVQWLQLQDGATTTAPATGALRSSAGALQVYDGAAWQTIATQAWVLANTAAPMDTATSTLHTHAR